MHLRESKRPTLLVRSFSAAADPGGVTVRLRGRRRDVTIRMTFAEAREAVRLVSGLCGEAAMETKEVEDECPF